MANTDPQQINPTPQQPPQKPEGTDGVDISELAQRVASLTAELERITHESESAMGGAGAKTNTQETPTNAASAQPSPQPQQKSQSSTTEDITNSPNNSAPPVDASTANPAPNVAPGAPDLNTPNSTGGDIPQDTTAQAPTTTPVPQGASREGVNLSSLKQRVLESSTFGSRVQPAAEEPFDPLDLTPRGQEQTPQPPTPASSPTAPHVPAQAPPAPPVPESNREEIPSPENPAQSDPAQSASQQASASTLSADSSTPPSQPNAEPETELAQQLDRQIAQNTPENVAESNELNTPATQETSEAVEQPIALGVPQEMPHSTPLPDTPPQPLAQEQAPASSPPEQPPTPTPEPRPTGPAHEFFDTIEWHARNDAAAQTIQQPQQPPTDAQAPVAQEPQPIAEEASAQPAPQPTQPTPSPDAPPQPPAQEQASTPVEPPAPLDITEPSAQPDASAQQAPAEQTAVQEQAPPTPQNNQPAPDAPPETDIPRAPIPQDDFKSLHGSDHAGVEFTPSQESDQHTTLEAEHAEAHEALKAQQHTIQGDHESQPTIEEKSVPQPASTGSAPSSTPPGAFRGPGATLSPLTGQAVSLESDEPVPTTLKPIRTFQDDIAQRVQTRDTSIVSVASAEQNRLNEEQAQKEREAQKQKRVAGGGSTSASTYIKIALSGIFIGVSIAGLAFIGYLFLQPSDTVVVETLPEYIFSDEQTRVDVTGQSRREFMNTLLAEKEKVSLRLGAISYLYLTLTARLPEGGERINLLSSTEFFERIEAEVPGSLTRSLEPMMMLGVHVFDGNPPFLIFKVNFYENAFAGMLQWEEDMQVDLAPLFGPAILIPQRPVEDESGGLGTQATLGQFTDEIVRNMEVRVLRNANDRIVLLYGFVDRNTLVITTNEFTFAEIVTRLSSRRF